MYLCGSHTTVHQNLELPYIFAMASVSESWLLYAKVGIGDLEWDSVKETGP